MLKIYCCTTFLFALSFLLKSQNIVTNGSFEEYTSCPQSINQVKYCKGWKVPTNGKTPEYFNACGNKMFSVPENFFGFEYAKDGNAYCGFALFAANHRWYAELIQGLLSPPLIKDTRYKIEFYVSLADSSNFAVNKINFCFSDTNRLGSTDKINNEKVFCPNKCISDIPVTQKDGWLKVENYYIAKGNEKYLTIGLFAGDMSTNELNKIRKNRLSENNPIEYDHAYYYIDNISIVKVRDD